MIDFFETLLDPSIPIIRNAIYAIILASIVFGSLGTMVVTKKITYMAGAISHASLGGIGIGLFIGHFYNIKSAPLVGGLIFAVLASLLIGLMRNLFKDRYDNIISAIWSLGMAIGIIFIAKTPGYIDPMNYLFGNILLISNNDLATIGSLSIIVILFSIITYHKFIAISFDEEFAKLKGINTDVYNQILLALVAVAVVMLVNVVGIILVIALLSLPPTIAGHFTSRLWKMMILSILISIVLSIIGVFISYTLDLPTGPTIIILASATYFISGVTGLIKWKRS